MPPKKRKAAVAAPKTDTKQVKIGDTSIIPEAVSSVSTPNRGSTRSSRNETPQYNFTRKRTLPATNDETAPKQASKKPRVSPAKTSMPVSTGQKRRGRPPKAKMEAASNRILETKPAVKKGILKKSPGRPRSSTSPAPSKAKASSPATSGNDTTKPLADFPPKKRGRKRKVIAEDGLQSDGMTDEERNAGRVATVTSDGDIIDETIQYWLMKAEPESRIENGVDVKFSIDDLQARTEPEGWDGVRNPVARNNMRAMRRGDLAFFYHSNCKTPGIVGVMRIVEEHAVDESAFDPNHPYYDPKSTREKPKWELVKVEFVKKFDEMLSLKQLRSFAEPGGVLQNMQMLKQSRLSVSGVQPKEWRFILDQVGEGHALGHPERSDGYESDTDGEMEVEEEQEGSGEEVFQREGDEAGDGNADGPDRGLANGEVIGHAQLTEADALAEEGTGLNSAVVSMRDFADGTMHTSSPYGQPSHAGSSGGGFGMVVDGGAGSEGVISLDRSEGPF